MNGLMVQPWGYSNIVAWSIT